jgi:hypothetical protein
MLRPWPSSARPRLTVVVREGAVGCRCCGHAEGTAGESEPGSGAADGNKLNRRVRLVPDNHLPVAYGHRLNVWSSHHQMINVATLVCSPALPIAAATSRPRPGDSHLEGTALTLGVHQTGATP